MRRLPLVWLALSVLLAACGKSTGNAPNGLPHAGGAGGEPDNAAGMPEGGVSAGSGGRVAAAGASAGGVAGASAGGVAGASAGGVAGASTGGAEGAEGGAAGAAGLAGSGPCLELSCLAGGQFVYVPTRQWQSSATPAGKPDAVELSEADYAPLLGPRYNVTFSGDAQHVEVTPSAGGDTVQGTRRTPPVDQARFELELFAGGRFVVQLGNAAWQAEYTVYGSGRPIVSSTRGELQSR